VLVCSEHETAIVELEKRQLQEQKQLEEKQLKEKFILQRQLLMTRQAKVSQWFYRHKTAFIKMTFSAYRPTGTNQCTNWGQIW